MKQKSQRNNKKQPTSKQPAKNLLAYSGAIEGKDTDILQEDLYVEFQDDNSGTNNGMLVDDKYVRFFDPTSSFLKGLTALLANSTTLRNIVNQKTTMVLGDGFVPVSADKVPFLQTLRKLFNLKTEDEKAIEAVNELIGNVNLNNETLEELLEKVTFDWWGFGNAIVELKKTKRNKEDVVLMYHIPLNQVGIKKANSNGLIEAIGVSSNWDDTISIKEIPLYPKFNSDGRSAIHIKNYAPDFYYWGLPENIAARGWAEIEYRIPKYNNTKFKNGFKPSAFIQVYGNFTKPEADEIAESFNDVFTGTGKTNKPLVQVMRSKSDKADVTLIDDKSDGNYIELQKLASQAIVTANRWTTSLAGLATSGKLGSNQQIRDELEFVTNTTIKQARRKIMQSIVNPFIKENTNVNKDIKGVMLHISNMNPISLASMLDPKMILTKNEQREVFGYESIDEKELEDSEGEQKSEENVVENE